MVDPEPDGTAEVYGSGESPPTTSRSGLSPVQMEVLTVLGARRDERPEFDPRLRRELRQELEDRLAPVADRVPKGRSLWLNKHLLSSVHGCEGHFLAGEEEEFAWTTSTARGSVSHKAIELSMGWRGDPAPGVLVDEAIARLIHSTDSISGYLEGLGEGERAELYAEAVERTAMFLECFPPLEPRWRPVPESRLRADLCDERIVLSGKVDLTVGRAEGLRAGKVLIDLKTGGFSPTHRDDLRFYALVEALRIGTPPRLLATYYLDGGRLVHEEVSEAVLGSALERVVRGAELVVALRHDGQEPVLRPGAPCRWCGRRESCETGQRWLADSEDRDGW